jgi:pilus assembly protein Flp/PilA
MLKLAKRFWNDEQGLELSEYAIMAALVIIVGIAAISALGGYIKDSFTALGTQIDTANTTAAS